MAARPSQSGGIHGDGANARAARVLIVGAGPIGVGVAEQVRARTRSLALSAVVDVDDRKVGTEVGGVRVVRELPPASEIDMAVVTTSSSLARVEPLLAQLVARGWPVVSTCEELVWPWRTQAAAAARIDEAARARGVAVLGTGVNPGFCMDALPLLLSAPCARVDGVRVERVQDASTRRRPFQDKVGVGQPLDEVAERLARDPSFGHQGLLESLWMIADVLDLPVARASEERRALPATSTLERGGRRVEVGSAIGVEQLARGVDAGGAVLVELVFRASFGEPRALDRVVIEGSPRIDATLDGGVPGDVATCAIVANALIALRAGGRSGLLSMADVVTPWRR